MEYNKSTFKREICAINAYIKTVERPTFRKLMLHLKEMKNKNKRNQKLVDRKN